MISTFNDRAVHIGYDALRAEGQRLREQLSGRARSVQASQIDYATSEMKAFIDVVDISVFATLWARPGLDMRTRALLCVVTDIATGCDRELALHLKMAMRQGATKEELTEAVLHLVGYLGAPRIREAMMIARDAFAAFDQEG